MCGRFLLTSTALVIADAFDLDTPFELGPRYNIAPAQAIAAVRASAEDGRRELVRLRWGLVPSWSKEFPRDARLINARSETVAEKPAFRAAFRARRCLVPADGFYEWQKLADGRSKQPFAIGLRDGGPFAIAGLWERWKPREGAGTDAVESCALLTTSPNELMAPIHDRMPVILPKSAWSTWLDPALRDPGPLQRLLGPYPADAMTAHPVSPWVNDPRHDDARCLEGGTASAQGLLLPR